MKVILEEKDALVIRFDNQEDIIVGLVEIANDRNILSGTFTVIGAAQKVTLSYYNLARKAYEDHTYDEDVEITSVIGNISRMKQDVIIHAHGTFANKQLDVIGGHIKSLIISGTGEVFIKLFAKALTRTFDEKTGLNLLQ